MVWSRNTVRERGGSYLPPVFLISLWSLTVGQTHTPSGQVFSPQLLLPERPRSDFFFVLEVTFLISQPLSKPINLTSIVNCRIPQLKEKNQKCHSRNKHSKPESEYLICLKELGGGEGFPLRVHSQPNGSALRGRQKAIRDYLEQSAFKKIEDYVQITYYSNNW